MSRRYKRRGGNVPIFSKLSDEMRVAILSGQPKPTFRFFPNPVCIMDCERISNSHLHKHCWTSHFARVVLLTLFCVINITRRSHFTRRQARITKPKLWQTALTESVVEGRRLVSSFNRTVTSCLLIPQCLKEERSQSNLRHFCTRP